MFPGWKSGWALYPPPACPSYLSTGPSVTFIDKLLSPLSTHFSLKDAPLKPFGFCKTKAGALPFRWGVQTAFGFLSPIPHWFVMDLSVLQDLHKWISSSHVHRPTPLERFPICFPCGTTVQPNRPGNERSENIEFQLGV